MTDTKKDKSKHSRSQLSNFASDSYLDRTSRPIYALMYLLPFILFYEIGTIIINPAILNLSLTKTGIRVVSFVWIRNILEYIGFSGRMIWIAVPLMVAVILLALQITSKTRWRIRLKDFIPMTFECILLAAPLIVLCVVFNRPVNTNEVAHLDNANSRLCQLAADAESEVAESTSEEITDSSQDTDAESGLLVDIVTGIGAGIYEELVFRLVLICVLMLIFQNLLHISDKSSVILSVLVSAVLFSAHHHIFFANGVVEMGEPFVLTKFVFRTLAGIYFAIIFAVRGFGIAAGTHAFYDIIAAATNVFLITNQV